MSKIKILILKIILNNLISNSLRYSDPTKVEKILSIRIDCNETNCKISVKDNGIGIPPKYLKNIFEQFSVCRDERRQPAQSKSNGVLDSRR